MLHLESSPSVYWYMIRIFTSGSYIKVIGWRSRSQEQKSVHCLPIRFSTVLIPTCGGLACMVLGSSALVSISEVKVNLRRARLILRWVTVSRFSSRCRTFIPVCNQPPRAKSAFHPCGIGKWVPASTGRGTKAGMVHSISGWTRGVQVKLWDPLRTRAILERLRGVLTTRYPRLPLPYPTLPVGLRRAGAKSMSVWCGLTSTESNRIIMLGCQAAQLLIRAACVGLVTVDDVE